MSLPLGIFKLSEKKAVVNAAVRFPADSVPKHKGCNNTPCHGSTFQGPR